MKPQSQGIRSDNTHPQADTPNGSNDSNAVPPKSRTIRTQKPGRPFSRGELFFAVTLFVSATLLFSVQPMFAKMALPLLGGAPAVWNTCLVFYQAVLLAGYLYAHLSVKWLGTRRQAWVHMVLLCLPWLVLPIAVAKDWMPPPGEFPVFWLWALLSVSVGLPFFLVSANAPMLQAWFSETNNQDRQDPYFLYAASNLGSLLALLAYPLVIELHLTLGEQSLAWTIGYGLLMLLILGCAIQLWRSSKVQMSETKAFEMSSPHDDAVEPPTWRRRFHWLALSFVPSSLLLGVTAYISTDLAAIPLFWVLPLALYLLTFVLVFARRVLLPLSWMLRIQPFLLVAAAGALTGNGETPWQLLVLGSLQLAAFFVTAMVCHGQLAADRPAGVYLTEFYLWMSLGGVLGGLFNALVAPLIFTSTVEYPLILATACFLRPGLEGPFFNIKGRMRDVALPAVILMVCGILAWLFHTNADLANWQHNNLLAARLVIVGPAMGAAFLLMERPLWFGLGTAALLILSSYYSEASSHVIYSERSFFGVLRVKYNPQLLTNLFMHGSTCHGSQGLSENERYEPSTYYHREGPLGRIFQALHNRQSEATVGVLGLGIGTIAAYGQPGERFSFYEIDPLVERIARDKRYFTYLADCKATTEVILGDARLSLEHQSPRNFDLLILDVFSSDSVPVHLITREAMQCYLTHLKPDGLLAIHISGRYLDLEPTLGRLAEESHLAAKICHDNCNTAGFLRSASTWVVMAKNADDLSAFSDQPGWRSLAKNAGPAWTDDFSNVVGTLRWKGF